MGFFKKSHRLSPSTAQTRAYALFWCPVFENTETVSHSISFYRMAKALIWLQCFQPDRQRAGDERSGKVCQPSLSHSRARGAVLRIVMQVASLFFVRGSRAREVV